MKKNIAIISAIAAILLAGCSPRANEEGENSQVQNSSENSTFSSENSENSSSNLTNDFSSSSIYNNNSNISSDYSNFKPDSGSSSDVSSQSAENSSSLSSSSTQSTPAQSSSTPTQSSSKPAQSSSSTPAQSTPTTQGNSSATWHSDGNGGGWGHTGNLQGEYVDAPGGRFWMVGIAFWYSEEDYNAGKPPVDNNIVYPDMQDLPPIDWD